MSPQLGVKILDDWIGTNRGDHGHVQDAPDLGATTPDTTAAAQATAVAVKGRQPGQRGDLFAIKCPQFGQVREQGGRRHLADSGHRAEQFVALAPDRGLADQTGKFVVDPESRFSSQRMCSSMLLWITLGELPRQFFFAVSSQPVGGGG